ncbi:MAG: tetratricopeptide repeat protein [Deltaproteobacteria bacterium]|nr:tetratricopeptide repeat protein [Deltaproteobacteria bacterium]
MLNYLTGPRQFSAAGQFLAKEKIQFNRAQALLTLGRRKEGLGLLRSLLSTTADRELQSYIAAAFMAAGEIAEGERVMALATQDQGGNDAWRLSTLRIMGQIQSGNVQAAVALIDRHLQTHPDDFEALSMKLMALLQSRRSDEASTLAQRIVTLHPQRATSHQMMGFLLMSEGKFPEALTACDRALALDPKEPLATANKATILMMMARRQEAIATIEEGLRHYPYRSDWWALKGTILASDGAYADAAAALKRAVEIDPWHGPTLEKLGMALHLLHHDTRALHYLDRAVVINEKSARVHIERGLVLSDLKRLDEAEKAFRRGVALGPPKNLLLDGIAGLTSVAAHRGRYTIAIGWAKQGLAIDPDHTELNRHMGEALVELERFQEALPYLERATQATDAHEHAFFYYNQALLSAKQSEKALAVAEAGLAKYPRSDSLMRARAFALLGLKRLHEAVAGFNQTVAVAPRDHDAFRGRGMAELDLRQPARAVDSFAAALTILGDAPGHVSLYTNYAEALVMLRRLPEALAALEKGRAVSPHSLTVQNPLCSVYLALERPADARRIAEEMIHDHPKRPDGYVNRAFALLMEDHADAGRADVDQALTIDPHDVGALALRAYLLGMDGRFAEAIPIAEDAVKRAPEEQFAAFTLGSVLAAANRYTEAIPYLQQAVAAGNDQARFNLGLVYVNLDRMDRVVETLAPLIHKHPDAVSAVLPYSIALAMLHRERKALALLKKVRAANPNNEGVLFAYFYTLAMVKETKAASAEFRKLPARLRSLPLMRGIEALLLDRTGQGKEAWQAMNRAVDAAPNNIQLRFLRAWRAYFERRYDIAKRDLALLSANGTDPSLVLLAALVSYREGQPTEGIRLLKPFVDQQVQSGADHLYLLAALHARLGHHDEAMRAMLNAMQRGDPSRILMGIAHEALQTIAAEGGKGGKATTDLDQLEGAARRWREQLEEKKGTPPILPPIPFGPLDFRWFNPPPVDWRKTPDPEQED